MSAVVALIVVGVIGVVLPVIPGIPLLAAGPAFVAPDHLLIRWGRVRLARWFACKGHHDEAARAIREDDASINDSRPLRAPRYGMRREAR